MSKNRLHRSLIVITTGILLSSCGVVNRSAPPEDRDRSTGMSERVFNEGDIIQEGVASWYGPQFHGKKTANGETYNMDDLTAAHKTLPFNTRVKVTNKSNGKSVQVRINDRGPYIGSRIIDLSRRAAYEIDMVNTGTGDVTLELIRQGDRPATSSNSSSRDTFTVQLGSFDTKPEAVAEAGKIRGAEVVQVSVGGKTFYRIYHGTYRSTTDAKQKKEELIRQGFVGFVKQREN